MLSTRRIKGRTPQEWSVDMAAPTHAHADRMTHPSDAAGAPGEGGPGDEALAPPSEATRPGAVLRARGVRYAFGDGQQALNGVDLEVGVGEIVALVGPRGSGKSTLLRIFAGELEPTEGTVERPGRRSSGGRVMLGYAPLKGAHFESLSGRENALFFARAGGMRRREAEVAVAELMEVLGLQDSSRRPVSGYTADARHRLLLVEALAHRPALSLLDDPFSGLGLRQREALIHHLRLRSAQRGTVVVAAEDLSLLPELADRLVFMHQGRVITVGRVAELLAGVGSATRLEVELEHRPQHLDVRFRPGVTVVSDDELLVLEVSRGRAAIGEVLGALSAAGVAVKSITVREPDLAEAFRRATGAELGS